MPILSGGGSSGGGGAGTSALIYRYTVAGADKASIDTGVDTPDAGSNNWTNGDDLEIYLVSRTDEAGAVVNPTMILNNNTGSLYDVVYVYGNNGTVNNGTTLAAAQWTLSTHGSGGSAGCVGVTQIVIPDYTGTSYNKSGFLYYTIHDSTAANVYVAELGLGFRDTSAITRLKIAAAGAAKFKIGTQLLVYKRSSS